MMSQNQLLIMYNNGLEPHDIFTMRVCTRQPLTRGNANSINGNLRLRIACSCINPFYFLRETFPIWRVAVPLNIDSLTAPKVALRANLLRSAQHTARYPACR
jgi:hypothetical protein